MENQPTKTFEGINVTVSLSFQNTFLPPFRDILIIGKECSLGMKGVERSLELLVPHGFEMHDIEDDDDVAAVIINRNILKRISAGKVLEILRQRVFPYMSKSELIKVDFEVMVRYDSFDVKVD
ncbi:MAG: hypothetical protein GF398_19005 [Chitinivibrionales bacterium]|nr:hypothetical protein [Chitinivibrionales bacterium]